MSSEQSRPGEGNMWRGIPGALLPRYSPIVISPHSHCSSGLRDFYGKRLKYTLSMWFKEQEQEQERYEQEAFNDR